MRTTNTNVRAKQTNEQQEHTQEEKLKCQTFIESITSQIAALSKDDSRKIDKQKIDLLESQKSIHEAMLSAINIDKTEYVDEQDQDEQDQDGGDQNKSSRLIVKRSISFSSKKDMMKFIEAEKVFFEKFGIPYEDKWINNDHIGIVYIPLGLKPEDNPLTMGVEELLKMQELIEKQTFDQKTKKWSYKSQEIGSTHWQELVSIQSQKTRENLDRGLE